MAAKSNSKGKQGEREVVALLNERLNLGLRRNPYEQQRQKGHYDIVGCDWMAIEVKRYAKAMQGDVFRWWIETCSQAGAGQLPVLAYRADAQQWRFVVPLVYVQDQDVTGYPAAGAYHPVELTTDGFCSLLSGMDSTSIRDILA